MRVWAIMGAACALSVSCAPSVSPCQDNYYQERSPTIPKDVRAFVIDAQGCMHFSGEVSGDAEIDNARGLPEKIKKLCTNIEVRHEKLLTKYRGNAEVEAIIAEVWEPFA